MYVNVKSRGNNDVMLGHSVLTEVLPVQRLSPSTKKTFEETSVRSLWCLHRGK